MCNVVGNPNIQAKLKDKSELKLLIANSSDKNEKMNAQDKLEDVEKALADETAESNVEKVKKYIKSVETLEGNFCQAGFWKLKQKL